MIYYTTQYCLALHKLNHCKLILIDLVEMIELKKIIRDISSISGCGGCIAMLLLLLVRIHQHILLKGKRKIVLKNKSKCKNCYTRLQ